MTKLLTLVSVLSILLSLLATQSGCRRPRALTTPPDVTCIDPTKVIDPNEPVFIRISITVFFYRDADERGWPATLSHRRYVRFMQDRGIEFDFRSDADNDGFVAMVKSGDVQAVTDAEIVAQAEGIEVPPSYPEDAHDG